MQIAVQKDKLGAVEALAAHWPEYLMETGCLAAFMLSACIFGALLEHPMSPLHQAIEDTDSRRFLMGAIMGITAVSLICSPWGRRSGAHMNPSVTLSFLALGKIRAWDAVFYVAAQFLGAVIGVSVADLVIGIALRHSAVNYVATLPGAGGALVAFQAELAISFLMMMAVLATSNSRRLHQITPLVAGLLVALFISLESPLSGMSMNPARTLGSAVFARDWTAIWVYFTAPLAGMLLAGQLFQLRRGAHGVFCAKLHHHNSERCIFRCNFGGLRSSPRQG